MARNRKSTTSNANNNDNNNRILDHPVVLQQQQQQQQNRVVVLQHNNNNNQQHHHHHHQQPVSLREWILLDRRGMNWVFMCAMIGAAFGFFLGATYLDTTKKQALATMIRSTPTYQITTGQIPLIDIGRTILDRIDDMYDTIIYYCSDYIFRVEREIEEEEYAKDIGHTRVFAIVREAIIREPGGYVHPDLGFLVPAPCGAIRGIGMVSNDYRSCQKNCYKPKTSLLLSTNDSTTTTTTATATSVGSTSRFVGQDVLIVVPLQFQMTRTVALHTLLPLIPNTTKAVTYLHELDDAALLTLLLAHERGIGRYSRWMPYIATLPPEPMCSFWYTTTSSTNNNSPQQQHTTTTTKLLDAIRAYKREYNVDIDDWYDAIQRATLYADQIVQALTSDYGKYIQPPPPGISIVDNIKWSLCQVTSRATAGSVQYGSLRLVPLIDLLNHYVDADRIIESKNTTTTTTNSEPDRDNNNNNVDTDGPTQQHEQNYIVVSESITKNLSKSPSSLYYDGAFVVRSKRHGRSKPLRTGQELLINYNIPHYTPLDWFISMTFIPPEKYGPWQRIHPVLPRIALHQQRHYEHQQQQEQQEQSSSSSSSSNNYNNDPDIPSSDHHYEWKNEMIQRKLDTIESSSSSSSSSGSSFEDDT